MKCLIKKDKLFLKNFKLDNKCIFTALEWTHDKSQAYIFESGSEAYDINYLLQNQGLNHCLVFMAEDKEI